MDNYDLARAKAVFRQRTIVSILRAGQADLCRKCSGIMVPGVALGQTVVTAYDFPGATEVTMSYGGPGEVVECRKCIDCGWSVT